MKTALKLLTLTLVGFFFASCCGVDNNYSCGKKLIEKEKVTYKEEVQTVYPSGKGGIPYSKIVRIPTVKKIKKYEKCVCGDTYCPKPDCCGVISKSVVKRATVQPSTGEPHLGLIPTMKPLVPMPQ